LPNGDWIRPDTVAGFRVATDLSYGPRVILDSTVGVQTRVIDFDSADAARLWAAAFGKLVNEALEA
jgi:hypothetical protein